ncbi:FtsK/SpoIIIE domain-containing protein [Rhodococcus sp. BS-15]|uniref:FtsK/SpoIIIE domain-containing protein n=1 Tax=Rhodococcus sp. BS-15 TaxID=1304954 RepID=UPI000A7E1266|nr:FtsK/SpoIIIE domain-containing protein [Rhodococcus sp. BS-15]
MTTAEVQNDDFAAALGISDLDDFDPRVLQSQYADDAGLWALLGQVTDEAGVATGELLNVDISGQGVNGAGSVGLLQGITGAGKSNMLGGIILSLAARYSPERVNFVLLNVGSHSGLQHLPHVVASSGYSDAGVAFETEASNMLRAEITRRETLIAVVAGVRDLGEYRVVQESRSDLPLLPTLVVIADEFGNTDSDGELGKTLELVSRKGRSLGIKLLISGQHLDARQIARLQTNKSIGISLRSADHASSNAVIGTPEAASLPLGKGDAILRQWESGITTSFRALPALPHLGPENARSLPERLSLIREVLPPESSVFAPNPSNRSQTAILVTLTATSTPPLADQVPVSGLLIIDEPTKAGAITSAAFRVRENDGTYGALIQISDPEFLYRP